MVWVTALFLWRAEVAPPSGRYLNMDCGLRQTLGTKTSQEVGRSLGPKMDQQRTDACLPGVPWKGVSMEMQDLALVIFIN